MNVQTSRRESPALAPGAQPRTRAAPLQAPVDTPAAARGATAHCGFCGEAWFGAVAFCPYCGHASASAASASTAAAAVPAPEAAPEIQSASFVRKHDDAPASVPAPQGFAEPTPVAHAAAAAPAQAPAPAPIAFTSEGVGGTTEAVAAYLRSGAGKVRSYAGTLRSAPGTAAAGTPGPSDAPAGTGAEQARGGWRPWAKPVALAVVLAAVVVALGEIALRSSDRTAPQSVMGAPGAEAQRSGAFEASAGAGGSAAAVRANMETPGGQRSLCSAANEAAGLCTSQ